jgi:uncharacterized membrane protein
MRLAHHQRHVAVLAGGFIASALVYAQAIGPYLTFDGEGPFGRFLKLFLLPITATAILLIVGSLRSQQPRSADDSTSEQAIDAILFFVILFLMSVHTLLLAVLLNISWVGPWTPRIVVVLVGLTTMAIGNLLPRTRPNYALGIRTARTLSDRQLWIVTHRVSGYVAVGVGAAIVGGGLLVEGAKVAAAAGVTAMIGAAITIVCYVKLTTSRRDLPQA